MRGEAERRGAVKCGGDGGERRGTQDDECEGLSDHRQTIHTKRALSIFAPTYHLCILPSRLPLLLAVADELSSHVREESQLRRLRVQEVDDGGASRKERTRRGIVIRAAMQ